MFLITSVSIKILYFDTKNAKPAGYQFLQTIPKPSSTQIIVTDFLFLEKIQEIVGVSNSKISYSPHALNVGIFCTFPLSREKYEHNF